MYVYIDYWVIIDLAPVEMMNLPFIVLLRQCPRELRSESVWYGAHRISTRGSRLGHARGGLSKMMNELNSHEFEKHYYRFLSSGALGSFISGS